MALNMEENVIHSKTVKMDKVPDEPTHTVCTMKTSSTSTDKIDEKEDDINNIKAAEKDTNTNLPIDRGWAWVVIIACFFEMLIVVGYFKCFGIFFVQFQRRFSSSSAATSVITSVQNACYSLSALLVMNLGNSMSSRMSVVIGAIVLSASFLITAFMDDLTVVYLTFGVFPGIFFAFVHPQAVTMTNTYFKKYRGLANNIAGCGVGVGALTMAYLYTSAFEHYGFTGTFIIAAGVFSNLAVVGMLLRPLPLEFYKNEDDVNKYVTERVGNTYERTVLIKEIQDENNVDEEYVDKIRSQPIHVLSDSGLRGSLICLSQTDAHLGDDLAKSTDTGCGRVVQTVKQILRNLWSSPVIKKPIFLFYLLCTTFLFCGCVLVESFIAPHAVDAGVRDELVSVLISASAIADFCSKLVFGFLSDRPWISRTTLLAGALLIFGIISFFTYFFNTFAAILSYAIVTGILQPLFFTLYPVIVVDILSIDELKATNAATDDKVYVFCVVFIEFSALGYISLAQGISLSVLMPLAGYLRDVTGSYYATFSLAGALICVGSLLCYILPSLKTTWEKRSADIKH